MRNTGFDQQKGIWNAETGKENQGGKCVKQSESDLSWTEIDHTDRSLMRKTKDTGHIS